MAEEEIFWADSESPKMIDAFKNAQKTFKYMWINGVKFDGNTIKGILINNPNELTNIANGDFVNVPLNQVRDWLFASCYHHKPETSFSNPRSFTPKTYGGFTIQAMRSEMTNKERKKHDNFWGLDFGDYKDVLLVPGQKEEPENLIEHPASKNMRKKLIEYLKENPSEISNVDENGLTFLHREVIAGNLTSVDVLLSFGVDKNVKTNQEETALDLAKKVNWGHIIPMLEK